jgi:DNA-binding NarL/FixJ family response regulator
MTGADGIVRVALVDDHELLRQALGTALDECPEVEVVGCFRSPAEALAGLADRQVDVVLLDRRLEHEDGIEAIRPLRERLGAQVLLLTGGAEPGDVDRALAQGAAGVAYKETGLEDLRHLLTHTCADS